MEAGANADLELAGNPFNGRIQDCHDCDHQAPQKIKYSKLAFLRKMKEMKDKLNAGEDVYNNAMLLANAYYNITHYGNGRYFYEGNVIGRGQSTPEYIDSTFRNMLVDMKLATKYYTQALNAAKTDEQKAKSHYMLAKCERNTWYNEGEEFTGQDNAFKAWNGFKALKQYAHTQYYKDVIKECGYFSTYINKR